MTPDGSKTGLEPIAERVPIERKIDLRFSNFEGLVTGVSANLSMTGMFIQSNSPEAAGTEFAFALRIEEWSPIQGTAKVVWIRPHSESPERPAGMGVQFVDLDAQSRRMIRWLVDKHQQEGGTPFDLDTVPAGASKYGGPRKKRARRGTEKMGARGPGAGLSPSRRPILMLLVLLVAAAAALGIYWSWFQDQPGIGALRPPTTAGVSSDSAPSPGAGGSELDASPAASSAAATVTSGAVAGFVESWAAAWEARDVEAVLSHYADDFAGPEDQGREAWLAAVQNRLSQADHIRVAVSALEISFPTGDAAEATFFRSLRSSRSDESGRMKLTLVATEEGWKITSQESLD